MSPRGKERALALVLVCALVLARTFVFTAYGYAFFDSDQAITGLMAKHLSEGRAFPLFFYGQTYMLGVEAWLAVPWFWLIGPGMLALRISLVVTNLAAATLIVLGLERWASLRPIAAVVAALFFLVPPPIPASFLMEAQGGNVEPFLYVALFWFLRRRAAWRGIVLGIGYFNREFTIYGAIALAIVEACEGTLFSAAALRRWAMTAGAVVAVWLAILAARPYADLMGPGTRGQPVVVPGGNPIQQVAARVRFVPAEIPDRLRTFTTWHMARLFGGAAAADWIVPQGRSWIGWLLAIALGSAAARLVVLVITSGRRVAIAQAPFAWYLVIAGLLTAIVYVAGRPASPGTLRYILLVLLLPPGLFGALLALDRNRAVRLAAAIVIVTWVASNGVDHWRLAAHMADPSERNIYATLERVLESRGADVAQAGYWLAYKVTFLSNERVRIASDGFWRIEEYQDLAEGRRDGLITIRIDRCPGGERVEIWYLCR